MKLTHKVYVDVEFNEATTPDYVFATLMRFNEEQMQEFLADVFVDAIESTGAIDKINEGNAYATVSFSKEQI